VPAHLEQVQQACRHSLDLLGLAYLDLYLLHSPGPSDAKGRADTWRGMEKVTRCHFCRLSDSFKRMALLGTSGSATSALPT
jgi:aryl-alcohol dehydrogenase-like predicted oxidoreductase